MQSEEEPSFLGIALNRIVAFAGPYIAVLAGALADWLFVNLNFLSNFHIGQNDLAQAIAQAIVFGITALIVWLGQQKWLDGFQKWAYGTGTAIANTQLPESYTEAVELPPSAPTTDPQATPEAAAGFEEGSGPVSG